MTYHVTLAVNSTATDGLRTYLYMNDLNNIFEVEVPSSSVMHVVEHLSNPPHSEAVTVVFMPTYRKDGPPECTNRLGTDQKYWYITGGYAGLGWNDLPIDRIIAQFDKDGNLL